MEMENEAIHGEVLELKSNRFELKGKPLSLGSKILAVVIAVGGLLLKATISPALDIDAVLKVAIFIVAIFGTIDLSMIASNIFGTRNGSSPGAAGTMGFK